MSINPTELKNDLNNTINNLNEELKDIENKMTKIKQRYDGYASNPSQLQSILDKQEDEIDQKRA